MREEDCLPASLVGIAHRKQGAWRGAWSESGAKGGGDPSRLVRYWTSALIRLRVIRASVGNLCTRKIIIMIGETLGIRRKQRTCGLAESQATAPFCSSVRRS
jgi:hypothetical protein